MAVTFGNLVATLGRGLLPVADLIAALSNGLFATLVTTEQPGGTFRRALPTWPRTWRYRPVLATESLAVVAAVSDDRDYAFDLSKCPEIRAGATITSGAIVGGTGLTIGTPVILDDEFDGIPAGHGISVRISGGTAGTAYKLACRAVLSNGRTVVVPGKLVKVADYEA